MFKRSVKRVFACILMAVGAVGLVNTIINHSSVFIVMGETLSCIIVAFVGGWLYDSTELKG